MTLEKHDLIHELPEYRDLIHELKVQDKHFARLFDDYHDIDHHIHRIETNAEIASDEFLEELKVKRLHLKDELFGIIRKAEEARQGV